MPQKLREKIMSAWRFAHTPSGGDASPDSLICWEGEIWPLGASIIASLVLAQSGQPPSIFWANQRLCLLISFLHVCLIFRVVIYHATIFCIIMAVYHFIHVVQLIVTMVRFLFFKCHNTMIIM